MDGRHQLRRSLGPDCPLAQQSAREAQHVVAHAESRQQIGNNIIVVAGVEGDFAGPPALRHATNSVQRLIPIERRHFNGADAFNPAKLAPEGKWQFAAPHRGLQVEAEQRNLLSDGSAMRDQLRDACRGHCGKAE